MGPSLLEYRIWNVAFGIWAVVVLWLQYKAINLLRERQ